MPSLFGVLLSWFPMLLLIAVWIFFMRQMQGGKGGAMGFGRSKAKMMNELKGKVTFNDVAGVEEAKEEVEEIVEFLKDPKKFSRLGGKIPRGALLVGPPGTGKTLLAKAVATETACNFIYVKGPEIINKYVGESEKMVRKLFQKARQNSPSILFFDEFDAIAATRMGGKQGKTTDTMVNQILTEIDGLEDLVNVKVIAATNRPDILDTALLRPGRFDSIILTPIPEQTAREDLLKIHTQEMPLAEDVDISKLARKTDGYVGADIEGVCREAAMIALRSDIEASVVQMDHFLSALEVVRASVDPDVKKAYEQMESYFVSARAKEMTISNDKYEFKGMAFNICVCNAQYFGGGWNISPKSSLQDGLFNIQVFAVTKLKAMQIFFLAKKGLHLKESSVKLKRLSQLTVNSKDPIEIDGDFFGYGPAEIFIKKRAIRFKI